MSTELVIFEKAYQPAELFVPQANVSILAYVRGKVDEALNDIEDSAQTEAGRAALKSLAFKVTKTKTAIEGARKELVEDEKARLKKQAEDAEAARLRAEQQAAADKVQAEADAKRREDEAAQRERDRIVEAAAAAKAEEEKREKDKTHRGKINKAAMEAIMEHGLVPSVTAKLIVTAIAQGKIPNVKISY